MEQLHRASLKILKETGMIFECDEAVEIFARHGAKTEGQTVYITEEMVDKALLSCPDTFFHRARNPKHSIYVGHKQKKLVVSASYGPVNILDPVEGLRPGTLEDYAKLTKLTQSIDTITMVGGLPIDPSDADPDRKNYQMLHRMLRHGDKPIWAFSASKQEIYKMFDMIKIGMGAYDTLFEHHVVAAPVCPLSPLKYAHTSAETLIAYAEFGQPVYINSCIIAGVSGPVSLLGTATLMNTEILAGLVLVQLVNPGTPVIYVPGSTVADMQTASYICGSPESNLITMVGLQMALERYRLPTRVMAGLSDAKSLDYQCGAETMQNLFMPLLSGAHYLNNCLGNMDGQMITSYEKFILDVESIERVLRAMRGIDGNDLDMSVELIQQEAHTGNYLMNRATFTRFKDRWRPPLTKWQRYDQWKNEGMPDAAARATQRCQEILTNCPESLLPPDVDADLARFVDEAP